MRLSEVSYSFSTRWCESVIDNGIYWSGLNLDSVARDASFDWKYLS